MGVTCNTCLRFFSMLLLFWHIRFSVASVFFFHLLFFHVFFGRFKHMKIVCFACAFICVALCGFFFRCCFRIHQRSFTQIVRWLVFCTNAYICARPNPRLVFHVLGFFCSFFVHALSCVCVLSFTFIFTDISLLLILFNPVSACGCITLFLSLYIVTATDIVSFQFCNVEMFWMCYLWCDNLRLTIRCLFFFYSSLFIPFFSVWCFIIRFSVEFALLYKRRTFHPLRFWQHEWQ